MQIFGVQIDAITRVEAVAALEQRQIIFTPNPEILLEARRNEAFREALGAGSMMLPDGHGLLFVSALQRFPKWLRVLLYLPALVLFLFWKKPFRKVLPEVVHGSDFMDAVVAWAAEQGRSVFFLGAAEGVAERTALYFEKKYPGLKLAGFSAVDPGEAAFEAVKLSGAEVLFVAYGAPKQELWMAEYADKLKAVNTMMGVGGSFDFWSGQVKRAPLWMRKMGLEWVWRLCMNPLKRARRIFNALIIFPVKALFISSSCDAS